MIRVLIATTNTSSLGPTDARSVGAYLPEIVDAWWVFRRQDWHVDLASVLGGAPPLEARNPACPRQQAFFADPEMASAIEQTLALGSVDVDDYQAVFFAGGHGAAIDFVDNDVVNEVVAAAYRSGLALGGVCHGPLALAFAVDEFGVPLINGVRTCGFTNDEERAIGMADVVPVLVQDALERAGAVYLEGPSFVPHIQVDGKIVTGQNPASATLAAGAMTLLVEPVEVGRGSVSNGAEEGIDHDMEIHN